MPPSRSGAAFDPECKLVSKHRRPASVVPSHCCEGGCCAAASSARRSRSRAMSATTSSLDPSCCTLPSGTRRTQRPAPSVSAANDATEQSRKLARSATATLRRRLRSAARRDAAPQPVHASRSPRSPPSPPAPRPSCADALVHDQRPSHDCAHESAPACAAARALSACVALSTSPERGASLDVIFDDRLTIRGLID